MIQVIVVPETGEFIHDVSHENVVWINASLGVPNLDGRNARYLAPCWLTEGFRGVNRVFHIRSVTTIENGNTEIALGNSFVLDQVWDEMGSPRKFEYHPLEAFGFEELEDGLLRRLQAN
jgi:hypothetical protein